MAGRGIHGNGILGVTHSLYLIPIVKHGYVSSLGQLGNRTVFVDAYVEDRIDGTGKPETVGNEPGYDGCFFSAPIHLCDEDEGGIFTPEFSVVVFFRGR